MLEEVLRKSLRKQLGGEMVKMYPYPIQIHKSTMYPSNENPADEIENA